MKDCTQNALSYNMITILIPFVTQQMCIFKNIFQPPNPSPRLASLAASQKNLTRNNTVENYNLTRIYIFEWFFVSIFCCLCCFLFIDHLQHNICSEIDRCKCKRIYN